MDQLATICENENNPLIFRYDPEPTIIPIAIFIMCYLACVEKVITFTMLKIIGHDANKT